MSDRVRSTSSGDKQESLLSRHHLAAGAFDENAFPVDFYDRETEEVALNLLGAILIHHTRGGLKAGRIVEVEAYLGTRDPACHVAKGFTPRTKDVFGRPGIAYVFVVYGLHLCLNAITLQGPPFGCVLIRAVEPWDVRGAQPSLEPDARTSGPGLTSRYLSVSRAVNGTSLTSGPVRIIRGHVPREIGCSPRIGISEWKDKLLRFYDMDSPFVSAM